MRRFTTFTAFSAAALLSGAAVAAQSNGLAAYNDNDTLNVKVSIDDSDGPARDRLVLSAFRDADEAVLDYSAGAAQSATRLRLSLAFPPAEHTGAEFLYVDVLDPAGFQIYEITILVEDLTVFVQDFTDGSHQGGDEYGPDIVDTGDKGGDGQHVPIGNPYGPDVLFPPGGGKPHFLNPPADPEFDFGDGSTAANAATIDVRRISGKNSPSGDFDDFDITPDDDGPPIGNPFGPDAIWPDSPLEDYNSQGDANDFGDGSGSGSDPFAAGDGDLGTGAGDSTLTERPDTRGQQDGLQDLNSQNDTGDGGSGDPFAPGDGDLGANPDDLTQVAAPNRKSAITIIEPSVALNPDDYSGQWPAAAYPQPSGFDCNGNGRDDALDIFNDPGLDMNTDGRIDRCVLNGDVNLDGAVNVMDLIALISAWGTCLADNTSECAGDLDGDGYVNEFDLTQLFNHWTD